MNDSLTLPTQFPDDGIEGRSSCSRSLSPASLGTMALALRARPLGTAPCHLPEHPSGKEKHQIQDKATILQYKIKVIGDFPGSPVVKNSPSNSGSVGSIPGQDRKGYREHCAVQKSQLFSVPGQRAGQEPD